jgi:type IV secretory pathway VirJ component
VGEAVRRYERVWNRQRLVVVGYSRGADIAPFVVNRLASDLHANVDGVVLLGPAGRASFEMTIREVVGAKARATDLPVMPELERLRGTPLVCAYGKEERGSFCSRVDSTLIRVVARDGGHRLAAADTKVVLKIMSERLGP